MENGNGNVAMTMPVSPFYGNGFGGTNGFGWGDGSFWIIILFLFAMMGGWGNGFGGFGNGTGQINNDVQRGFDQQSVMNSLNTLTGNVANGFANAEVSRCNGQTNILQALNQNQTATMQSMNTLASGLQNCCCENRSGLADLKYTVATENCADRAAVSDGIRDVLAATQAQTQTILDKLCQQEIDALKTQNANLQTQLNMANLASSQTAQTAQLIQDNNAQTAALINRIAPYPVPAYPVANPYYYGNTGCCNGCGCGNM